MDNVKQMPTQVLWEERKSQADRLVMEIMENLYKVMVVPAKEFTLQDGTRAKVKEFYAPKEKDNGDKVFGFDVVFPDKKTGIDHIEFTVVKTGWGGGV